MKAVNSNSGRMPELDSLRGLAAILVVIHHAQNVWTSPTSLAVRLAPRGSIQLFFLLSGFVLASQRLRGKGRSYGTFMARRVVRLYLPYLCSLTFAIAGAYLLHGHYGMGAWVEGTWSGPVSVSLVLQHVLFLGNYDCAQFNTSIWSLVHEMRISIIFPVIFALVSKSRAYTSMGVAGCLILLDGLLVAKGRLPEQTTVTLDLTAIIVCGALLAKHLTALSLWYQRLNLLGRSLFSICSIGLLCEGHLLTRTGLRGAWIIGPWVVVLGAVGVMLISLNSAVARKILNQSIPRFLGRISYSLYLTHGTVLFTLLFTLHGRVSPGLLFPTFLVVSLLLSFLFWKTVEAPLTRVSQRIGKFTKKSVEVKVWDDKGVKV